MICEDEPIIVRDWVHIQENTYDRDEYTNDAEFCLMKHKNMNLNFDEFHKRLWIYRVEEKLIDID